MFVCRSVEKISVSFWRGFVNNTNIYHCWGVECSITIQAQKMNKATLRLFSLDEQCHTQKSYLRCFNSDFDAVKSKFGLLLE